MENDNIKELLDQYEIYKKFGKRVIRKSYEISQDIENEKIFVFVDGTHISAIVFMILFMIFGLYIYIRTEPIFYYISLLIIMIVSIPIYLIRRKDFIAIGKKSILRRYNNKLKYLPYNKIINYETIKARKSRRFKGEIITEGIDLVIYTDKDIMKIKEGNYIIKGRGFRESDLFRIIISYIKKYKND